MYVVKFLTEENWSGEYVASVSENGFIFTDFLSEAMRFTNKEEATEISFNIRKSYPNTIAWVMIAE